MCEHKQVEMTTPLKEKPSLAVMWRAVYLTADEHDCFCRSDRDVGCCYAGKKVPQDRIIIKDCACCESRQFTEVDDYICLWCRYYDPSTPLSVSSPLDKTQAEHDLKVQKGRSI
jgi:hypothetical protein